jgi:hypothetical protein
VGVDCQHHDSPNYHRFGFFRGAVAVALADYDAYVAAMSAPDDVEPYNKTLTTLATKLCSWWRSAGVPGIASIPSTTAAACDRTTTGAVGQQNGGAGRLSAFFKDLNWGSNAFDGGVIIVADRLLHVGGLSGTVTTAQTVGGALTRYTDGVGVLACYEVYTQIGTTGTTITASYTDQDGNAGQTTIAQPFGGTGFREASLLLPFHLASGDSGVRAVASCTVLATTATAGSFGVTLFKPLLAIPVMNGQSVSCAVEPLLALGGQLPEVLDDACLQFISFQSNAGSRALQTQFCFTEV